MNIKSATLALASPHGDPKSPAVWSGTPARIYGQSEKYFGTCEPLNYRLAKPLDFAMRATTRLLPWWSCARHWLFNPFFERQFLTRWRSLPKVPEACLHISDFCVPASLPGGSKHFIYTDSTMVQMTKYLPKRVSAGFLQRYRTRSRNYLQSVDTVFTLNEWTRQSFIHDHGHPAERVFNVRFGINIEPFNGPKDFSSKLMLIVLRPKLEEIKGLNLLLAALPQVRAAIPDAHLAVVGTDLQPCPAGVTCYFNQPRSKTIELMRRAALYTMPALCEPNGIVYPEALASRTPILGLNRMAFPEFAGNGEFGFIVPEARPEAVAHSIITALKTPSRLQEMAERGQQFVSENYSWDRTGKLISDHIAAVLK